MLCTAAALKKVLNVFAPSQFENLDGTRKNAYESSSPFQDGEQEKDDLYLRGVTRPTEVKIISTTPVGEEDYSYLKSHDMMESCPLTFDHRNHYGTDSDTTPELDDDDIGEDADLVSSVTNPIVFSEDPVTCSNEMLEFANDLVDIIVSNIAESKEIMDASDIEDLSWWKQSLDRTSEKMKILDTDTPTERLLKARTYLMGAGALLKRVVIVVEHAKSLHDLRVHT